MTEEVKKLIESVAVKPIKVEKFKNNEFCEIIIDYVRESDFDRVVEELTKQIYLSD